MSYFLPSKDSGNLLHSAAIGNSQKVNYRPAVETFDISIVWIERIAACSAPLEKLDRQKTL